MPKLNLFSARVKMTNTKIGYGHFAVVSLADEELVREPPAYPRLMPNHHVDRRALNRILGTFWYQCSRFCPYFPVNAVPGVCMRGAWYRRYPSPTRMLCTTGPGIVTATVMPRMAWARASG